MSGSLARFPRGVDPKDLLTEQVREAVRQSGVNPVERPETVRQLVADSLANHEDAVLAGSASPLVEAQAWADTLVDSMAGFGPLQKYLDDPDVEELWINAPSQVFVARKGRSELTTVILESSQVRDLVERMLKPSGRRVDLSSPFVDAMLPDGSRLHVVIPDITAQHWAVNIRKFVAHAHRLDDLVDLGSMTSSAAAFLDAAVRAGLNVIVSGATQAGKTTLLNCLLAAIPSAQLEGTGEIPLRRLVKEALRMRPDRLVVGEVRQEEALDLLIALNSGLPGMCSVHANSAREAVTKLCTLPLLAGENVSAGFVVPTVASSVDVVVHVARDQQGKRRVREIVALPGRAEGSVIEIADLFVDRPEGLTRAAGFPPHADRFAAAGIDVHALLAVDYEVAS
ncbi:MAG: ATPase, T2SS/T4P/T4SS family [Actinobacteria bacterium]|nr:ATPase, T2SS/T4P/T4SS family [Actinomycetota bacterium]